MSSVRFDVGVRTELKQAPKQASYSSLRISSSVYADEDEKFKIRIQTSERDAVSRMGSEFRSSEACPSSVKEKPRCDRPRSMTAHSDPRSRSFMNGMGRKREQVVINQSIDEEAISEWKSPMHAKSEESQTLIKEALSKHFLFARLSDTELTELSFAMFEVNVQPGDYIIRQGEPGDNFYVVDSGEFVVDVDGTEVGNVCRGQSFGELALMHNSTRAASLMVTSSTAATVWALDRETFRMTVAKQNSLKEAYVVKVLRQCDLFSTFTKEAILALARSVLLVSFKAGERIIEKGVKGHEMFIIQRGGVSCEIAHSDESKASQTETEKISIKLGQGDYFGERALLFQENRAADVYAIDDVDCYCIASDIYNYVIGTSYDVIQKMQRQVKRHILESLGMLSHLEKERRRQLLEGVADLMVEAHFDPGTTIIRAGEETRELVVIRSGSAIMERVSGEKFRLYEGACFGESVLAAANEKDSKAEEKSELSEYTVTAGPDQRLSIFRVNREDLLKLQNHVEAELLSTHAVAEVVSRRASTSMVILPQKPVRERPSFSTKVAAPPPPPEKNVASTPAAPPLGELPEETRLSCSHLLSLKIKSMDELELHRTLGQGSFGQVKLAVHKPTNTVFALKILLKFTIVETRQTQNIMREKRIVSQLSHVNVLRLYGTFQDQDYLYMAFELIAGGELYRLMHGVGGYEEIRLPLASVKFYTAQILAVYEYIHAKSILYRDLKPENILINGDGYLKVIDWGFAKETNFGTTYTQCGTPEYISPEQINCRGHTKSCDYWSLGVLVYEMLVGTTPYVGDDPDDRMEIYHKITLGEWEWPEDIDVDKDVNDLVRRLMTLDPLIRLGCLKNGVNDIMTHSFFDGFQWEQMRNHKMEAPWIPEVKDDLDVSNFDIYSDEEDEFVPYDGDQSWEF